VAGARPNFVKVAPLLRVLRGRPLFEARLVHTGQHHDPTLSDLFFHDLEIPPPDAHLGVGSGTHASQTAEIMRRFESVVSDWQPHVILVVGDVNSTLACALVAAKFVLEEPFETRAGQRRRPLLVHVEAGLRSFDNDMPEEINRRVTDGLSDLLYVSEPSGLANLRREGIPVERVAMVGNLMIDSLLGERAAARTSTIPTLSRGSCASSMSWPSSCPWSFPCTPARAFGCPPLPWCWRVRVGGCSSRSATGPSRACSHRRGWS
jgi:UDP-N-acetylglucosamine 2-epimerase (non-hydrolysing)